MSASLVRKSLAIVDPEFDTKNLKRKKRKTEIFTLAPDNHKLITKSIRKGKKGTKVNLLSTEKKITVSEARKNHKSKEQILRENLRKLEIIRESSKVDLDEKTLNQIIERAVTRRPLTKNSTTVEEQQTAFTEEDFKKFEEEFLAE